MHRTLCSLCAILPLVGANGQNNALDFDGLDDVASAFGASAFIAAAPGLSLSCWVYPRNAGPAFPDFDGIIGFRNDVDADFYMVQISPTNTVEARLRNSAGTAFTLTAPALTLNTWQHLVLVYDGAFLTLYLNGNSIANTPASGTISNAGVPLYVGDLYYLGNHFYLDGRIDEATVWSRALTQAEVNCIMDAGLDPVDPDLQFYYKCDQGTPGGNNTSIVLLDDEQGNIDAALTGFSLITGTSNFVSGVPVGTTINATICQGETYTLGGQLLTAPGIYTENYPVGGACDSIVTVILDVTQVNTAVAILSPGPVLTATPTATAWQWLDCDAGQAPISGATASTYTPSIDGEYAVVVTQNGCTDTSACYTILGAGIAENVAVGTIVRFDPVSDLLWTAAPVGTWIAVLDAAGRAVAQRRTVRQQEQWPMRHLPPGVYLVRALDGTGPHTARFMKP